jgi:hypothetical protein
LISGFSGVINRMLFLAFAALRPVGPGSETMAESIFIRLQAVINRRHDLFV